MKATKRTVLLRSLYLSPPNNLLIRLLLANHKILSLLQGSRNRSLLEWTLLEHNFSRLPLHQ